MPEYDDRGKVSIWKSEIDHPQAPQATGHFFAHRDIKEGEKVRIALWKNDSINEKAPVMTGKISDPKEQQHQQHRPPPPPAARQDSFQNFDDDDIPF